MVVLRVLSCLSRQYAYGVLTYETYWAMIDETVNYELERARRLEREQELEDSFDDSHDEARVRPVLGSLSSRSASPALAGPLPVPALHRNGNGSEG
jgi:hypothetical protein